MSHIIEGEMSAEEWIQRFPPYDESELMDVPNLTDARPALTLREIQFTWACPLCQRSHPDLERQKHHLRTKAVDPRRTVKICRECHFVIHGLFARCQLQDPKYGVDSVPGLLGNEYFQRALAHIRTMPPDKHLRRMHKSWMHSYK